MRESNKMSEYITLSELVESIETQFTDLGLELDKVDDELQWLYLDGTGTHRATLSVLFWTSVSNRLTYRVEVWNGEPNEDGTIRGKVWNSTDGLEQVLIILLKKIAEINRA